MSSSSSIINNDNHNANKNKATSTTAHAGSSANAHTATASRALPSSSSSSPSTNTPHPACAACRYQRRRCTPDCVLAPHFPAHQQRQFQNAHRLFGVKNIHRIIDNLDAVRRTNAMRSIIFESNARARDPVGGCLRIICELERQLQYESAELTLVLQQLAIYRAQAESQSALPPASAVVTDLDANPNLILNGNEGIDNGDVMYMQMHQDQVQQQPFSPPYYDYFYDDGGCDNNDNNENNEEGKRSNSNNSINNNMNNNSSCHSEVEMQVQELSMLSLQHQHAQQEHEQQQQQRQFGIEDDEVKPICDMFEVRQVLDDEQDPNPIDINAGEPFPCRLGLGFSCY